MNIFEHLKELLLNLIKLNLETALLIFNFVVKVMKYLGNPFKDLF